MTLFDYKGLMKTAIREPSPVGFIESKRLYRTKSPVSAGEYAIPFGKAAVRRTGRDVTMVAFGSTVPKALAAAETLAAEGIEAEVIDPHTLLPLDAEMIFESIRRAGRLVVFQEAYVGCSFGLEIARVAAEKAFEFLKPPVKVLGSAVPIPSPLPWNPP